MRAHPGVSWQVDIKIALPYVGHEQGHPSPERLTLYRSLQPY